MAALGGGVLHLAKWLHHICPERQAMLFRRRWETLGRVLQN